MKKAIAILLVALIIGSTFSFVSAISIVKAEPEGEWPGIDVNSDGKINIYDTIEHVKSHYIGYDAETGVYQWDFVDAYDATMADYFMQSVLFVEYVRDSNDDKSVFELVDKLLKKPGFEDGIDLKNFDDTNITVKDVQSFVYFVVKNFLANSKLLTQAFETLFESQQLIDLLMKAGLTVKEIGVFKQKLVIFLVEEGEEWLILLEQQVNWVTLGTIDSAKAEYSILTEVSDYFRVAITIYDLINIAAEHIMDIIEIGVSNIMESVKQYEIFVETIRMIIELVGKIAMAVGENVIQPHFVHGLVTVCAPLAIGGPAGIVAATVVGVAGIVFYFTVKHILEKAFDFAADETLGLDLAIHKKLSATPKAVYIPLYHIKVVSINTLDEDNYIPWGRGYTGEDVYVVVRNVGVRTLNIRVEPEITSIDPETGKTGWSIDDKQWRDLDNWIEKENIKPGEYVRTDFCFHVKSGTIEHRFPWPFSSINDVWVPGENPGLIYFKFYHDIITDWWDIFDLIGGLRYLDSELGIFYNSVEVLVTPHKGLDVTLGETFERTIDVKNMKSESISFVPEVFFFDSLRKRYDSSITFDPTGQIVAKPGETVSFTLTWTIPNDAPTGFYQVAINVKKPNGERYTDNLALADIFFVYQLRILIPTESHPAIAGDPNDPNPIFVYVTGLPPLEEDPVFSIRIPPPVFAEEIEIVDRLPVPAGYTLKVTPPLQASEGKYDLEVGAYFGSLYSLDSEPNAVEYALAPSVEPIEKGLEWLRTRQYDDGSWYHSVGITSLAVLAFINSGYDESDPTVSKAIEYILSNVQADGSISSGFYRTYETSIAILPLVATHNDAYTETIENAKNWLVVSQWDEDCIWGSVNKDNWYYGGFGYGSHTRPDLSNTQWALMGLDAAGLPLDDPTWKKAQIFLARCQNRHTTVTIDLGDGTSYTVQPYSWQSNDGGFIYVPGGSLAGGTTSYGSMTAAGIWSLLLCDVDVNDPRLKGDGTIKGGLDWIADHYTWDTNPGMPSYMSQRFVYYYYVTLSKALTMARLTKVNEHDWYQDLNNKLVSLQYPDGHWVSSYTGHGSEHIPELATAYSILALQTKAAAPPVQRLSYLTFILRSNAYIRILDSEGNLVGYNYMTGLGENQIQTAVYSGLFAEQQYIVIVNPGAGTYDLELIGVSEGPYTLTIQGNYGEEVTDTFEYTGDVKPAELHGSEVTVTAIVGPIDIYPTPPKFEEIIDTTPPSITVETPLEGEALQDGVTLQALVSDPSGVDWVTFSIREPNGEQGTVIDPMFESMPATLSAGDRWQLSFDTTQLPDGYYLAVVEASDMLGNEGFVVVQFSIRNWACVELLPASESNKGGRTMPVKFSLRVVEAVDPAQPFVWNEELTIIIYEEGHRENILQNSTYGITARDYRIDPVDELYITNFKTLKKPTTYVVEIYRKGMLIGSFEFTTVK